MAGIPINGWRGRRVSRSAGALRRTKKPGPAAAAEKGEQPVKHRRYDPIPERLLSKYALLLMRPDEMLDVLIRGYYRYILENPEAFCFVEQFSGCPALANSCSGKTGVCRIYSLIEQLREAGCIRDYDSEVLFAAIFYPVKAIAADSRRSPEDKEKLLTELIDLAEHAVLL